MIHSYTPSVRALMNARDRTGRADGGGDRPTLVVLAGTATADAEDRFWAMAPEATIVSGSHATVARVTAELSRHRPAFFHYDGPVELDGAPPAVPRRRCARLA